MTTLAYRFAACSIFLFAPADCWAAPPPESAIIEVMPGITPRPRSTELDRPFAAPGDVLFQQLMEASEIVRLAQPINQDVRLGWKGHVAIGADDILYRVLGGPSTWKIYCTVHQTSSSDTAFGANRTPTCLADTDGDQRFDRAYRMAGVLINFDVSPGTLDRGYALDGPIPYSADTTSEKPLIGAGIQYVKGELHLVLLGRNPTPLVYTPSARIPPPAQLPKQVSISGATLEIDAVAKEGIAYKIISGFPVGEVFHVRWLGTH